MGRTHHSSRLGGGSVIRWIAWLGLCPLWAWPATAQSISRFDLDQAICANNWDSAIGIVGRLIADDLTSPAERHSLLTLRRQLERFRTENILVADSAACDRSDPYVLNVDLPPTVQAGQPLNWTRAVTEATENNFSAEIITSRDVPTLPVSMGNIPGLTPAEPIDLSRGLNVVSGHVGAGHNVYGFVARMGDRIDLNLEVTQVMAGSLYTSDDSQLFVFDRQGNLLAAADDNHESNQSRISDLIIPRTGLYFAVVTSYNNDPILGRQGQLMGWQDNGGGRFDYTLSLSGATPTSAMVR